MSRSSSPELAPRQSTPTGLRALIGPAATRWFAPGASLVDERGRSEHLHLLTDGWAYRYATTRDGARQILAVLLPGDFCNLDGLSLACCDYGVRALTPVTTLSLSPARAMTLAAQHAELMQLFLRRIAVENAMLGRWTLCLGRKSSEARLAHFLCQLATRLGASAGEDSFTFDLPLSQEQIADVLGLTPVHVNRTLQNMRANGSIATRGRSTTIPSLSALCRVGEFDPGYLHQKELAAADGEILRAAGDRMPADEPGPAVR